MGQFCYPKAEKAGSKDAFEKADAGWIQWQPKKGITNQWSPPLSNEAKSLVLCKAFTEFKTGIHAYSSILDLEQGRARQAILLQQKYILTFYLKKGKTPTSNEIAESQ